MSFGLSLRIQMKIYVAALGIYQRYDVGDGETAPTNARTMDLYCR